MMFYRARYYNPAWGRFVSEDPIGVAGGVNLYGYVGGQPIGYRDPNGLCIEDACIGEGAATVELAIELYLEYQQRSEREGAHSACDRIELHHITPKYLGGAKKGPLAAIPRWYHQLITNAFRELAPYGKPIPSPEKVLEIMKQVYDKLPLP